MSATGEPGQEPSEARHRDHVLLYVVLGVALGVLAIVGIAAYDHEGETAEATQKATELEQRWESLGLTGPANRDVLIRIFGSDGGAICDTTDDDLTQAWLRSALANGAAGPGQRAVIVDEDVVAGERAVVEVYCPDQLEEFDDFVDDLDFDHVVRDS